MSTVLVIAGTDPGGGAGLVRDIATLTRLGVAARCAVTAVTAQTDAELSHLHALPSQLVRAQLAAALAGAPVAAVKIGMLANAEIVECVAEALALHPLLPVVLDPVLAASSGAALLDARGLEVLRARLLPRALLLTPNLVEAAVLLDEAPAADEVGALAQAHRLLACGAQAVLLKGGHAAGAQATDLLVRAGAADERLAGPRIAATLRGTGCALASAIAAHLARGGSLLQACRDAKAYVSALLQEAATPR